jgi:hypothetical protein
MDLAAWLEALAGTSGAGVERASSGQPDGWGA